MSIIKESLFPLQIIQYLDDEHNVYLDYIAVHTGENVYKFQSVPLLSELRCLCSHLAENKTNYNFYYFVSGYKIYCDFKVFDENKYKLKFYFNKFSKLDNEFGILDDGDEVILEDIDFIYSDEKVKIKKLKVASFAGCSDEEKKYYGDLYSNVLLIDEKEEEYHTYDDGIKNIEYDLETRLYNLLLTVIYKSTICFTENGYPYIGLKFEVPQECIAKDDENVYCNCNECNYKKFMKYHY